VYIQLQLSDADLLAALLYSGPRLTSSLKEIHATKVARVVRLALPEDILWDAVKIWLEETKGYVISGPLKWSKGRIEVTVDPEREPVSVAKEKVSAEPREKQEVPEKPHKTLKVDKDASDEEQIVIHMDGSPAEAARAEAEGRKAAIKARKASLDKDLYDQLPEAIKKIHRKAAEEAGVSPDTPPGELPSGSYAHYPGPVGPRIVLKKGSEE